ncbi:hypothetical protein Dsin_028956 [Dipteronia sinensis]|uniref:Helicase ATP-binding domain-containing protein n=1 Tax=Dipteronia sinensis TaxID=43782 RepID=A0AAD9ZS72_9ROSI|nr:hypothetical protein Dsin_028956 [Dipteronia sinensis]
MSDTKRASAASLRGWGDGGSIHNPEYESTNLPKQRWKLNAEKDFFSRKKQMTYPLSSTAMAFAPVIEGKSCILADRSGSGKTLAYLVPLIQRLRQEELQGHSKSLSRSPRVVVMVPTAELASQILQFRYLSIYLVYVTACFD